MQGLVLNLGLKSIRAIVFDSNGKAKASAFKPVNTFLSRDFVEQQPEKWWEKGLECIKAVLKKENKIDFMTVTSSSACLIPVQQDGACLSNAIMVSDKRALKESLHISQLDSFKKLPFKALPYYSIPKILWIKNNWPKVYAETHKFLSPNDFLFFKLTGGFCIDELNATKYYTLNNSYPKELLKDLNIDEEKLPDIKPIGSAALLSSELCKQLNLDKNVKVVITTYDALCAFFGSRVKEEGDACDMSGTCTSLRVLTKKKIKKGEERIFENKFNEWNIVGASNNLCGGLIDWALEVFYHKHDYDKLDELSNRFSAKTGLIFLPYLLGERAPIWDNEVRGSFLGIERFHDKQDLARAVLEATGFCLRGLIEAIEENGIAVRRLYVGGGLSKIDLINQIKADITGREIFKLKETESTSLGAYCLARQSIDKLFDASSVCAIEKKYSPDLEKHKTYSTAYALFEKAYHCLKEFHHLRANELAAGQTQMVNL